MERRTRRENLARLLSRIDLDAFADRVLESYWSEQEAIGTGEPRRSAHMWVKWNLTVIGRWLLDGQPPSESELERLRARAREQAQNGVPTDVVTGNLRRAARFAWNAALELADEPERPALLETADLVFAYVDRVSRIHAEAQAEVERAAPLSLQERIARGLLNRICRGEPPVAEDVELARELDVELEGAFRPVVVALPSAPPDRHLLLAAQLRERRVIAVSEGRWVLALLQGASEVRELRLPTDALVAAGDLASAEQIGRALDELRMLVDVARSHGHSGLVDPQSYLPELLLRTSPRIAAQIRHRIYGPLRQHAELARTLDALVEANFNRLRAAETLPVHRNTFRDRLARIAELTGLDLDSVEDRGLTWLAYLCAPGRVPR